MGTVASHQYPSGGDGLDTISEFDHDFSASLEDCSPGILPKPLPGYVPSTGPPRTISSRVLKLTNEPLTGRLVKVHMLGNEIVLQETTGLKDQTLTRIPYAAIRRLTWDHSQSSLKVGYAPSIPEAEADSESVVSDPDDVFVTIRVENSLELEEELKQRGMAEIRRTSIAGLGRPALPSAVYLGMFAGVTKPKPFQRKRPNLSLAVPEGQLPSLQVSAAPCCLLLTDKR